MFFKKSSLLEPSRAAPQVEATLLPESVPLPLEPFMTTIVEVLGEFDPSMADLDVARAKWADVCRDISMDPLEPLEMDGFTTNFDRSAVQRLALIVSVLERLAIPRDILARLLDRRLRTATAIACGNGVCVLQQCVQATGTDAVSCDRRATSACARCAQA